MRIVVSLLLLTIFFTACRPDTYTPKPRGYFAVDLPQRGYQLFNDPSFPYSFEYPKYARIVRDTTFFGKKPENPYWINIELPSLGGNIYISYKIIGPSQSLSKVLEDTYEMTMYHNKRADYIGDYQFNNDSNHVHGILYNPTGNAASAYQFYATDSVKHYMRAALYFDVSPNADSLKPVNDFMRADMEHIMETLTWK